MSVGLSQIRRRKGQCIESPRSTVEAICHDRSRCRDGIEEGNLRVVLAHRVELGGRIEQCICITCWLLSIAHVYAAPRRIEFPGNVDLRPSRPFPDDPEVGLRPSRRFPDDPEVGLRPSRRFSDDPKVDLRPSRRFPDDPEVGLRPSRRFPDDPEVALRPSRRFPDDSEVGLRPSRRFSDDPEVALRPSRRFPDDPEMGWRPSSSRSGRPKAKNPLFFDNLSGRSFRTCRENQIREIYGCQIATRTYRAW